MKKHKADLKLKTPPRNTGGINKLNKQIYWRYKVNRTKHILFTLLLVLLVFSVLVSGQTVAKNLH